MKFEHQQVKSRAGRRPLLAGARAFTLIELILVMTILTIAVSVTAPALANFFRGRSLDSEARRVLALTRAGQSRAAAEGVPVELWIDNSKHTFGLEAEPSYEQDDPKALEFELAPEMRLEVQNTSPDNSGNVNTLGVSTVTPRPNISTTAQALTRRSNLPRIRFLPDGTVSESSPKTLHLTGYEGMELWLVQSRNGLSYEIRNQLN